MEAGHSFTDSKPKYKMAKRFSKHLKETQRRRRSEDLEYKNKLESKSEDDCPHFVGLNNRDREGESPARKPKLVVEQEGSAMTEHQKNILRKSELSLTNKELNQLRYLQI